MPTSVGSDIICGGLKMSDQLKEILFGLIVGCVLTLILAMVIKVVT